MYKRLCIKYLLLIVCICFVFLLTSCKKKELTKVEVIQSKLLSYSDEIIYPQDGFYSIEYSEISDCNNEYSSRKLTLDAKLKFEENNYCIVEMFKGEVFQYNVDRKISIDPIRRNHNTFAYDKNKLNMNIYSTDKNTLETNSLQFDCYKRKQFEIPNVCWHLNIYQRPMLNFPIDVCMSNSDDVKQQKTNLHSTYVLTATTFLRHDGIFIKNGQQTFELVKTESSYDAGSLRVKTYIYYITENLEIIEFIYKERNELISSISYNEKIINIKRCNEFVINPNNDVEREYYIRTDIEDVYIEPNTFSIYQEFEK